MHHLVAATASISTPPSCCKATPTSRMSEKQSCSCLTQWPQSDHSSAADLRWARTGTSATNSAPRSSVVVSAFFGLGGSKGSSAKAAGKGCFSCAGKGAIECQGCKGSGKNKKNGNMFERWKCYDCQGFGMVGCPKCGSGGLTPEQRGER